MSYSEAQKNATRKYNKKAYDRIEIQVYKGEKELIKNFAEEKGMSVNSYITGLIRKDMGI